MSYQSLLRLAVIVVILSLLLGGLACSGSTPTGEGDIMVTSSVNSGHSHKVTISGADIENPPVEDKTIDTTYVSGHRHTVTLTPENYGSIKNGDEVTVTSSSSAGHTHTFVIRK